MCVVDAKFKLIQFIVFSKIAKQKLIKVVTCDLWAL